MVRCASTPVGAALRWLQVEKRPVAVDELGSFSEVAACGTAVVLTPISSISHFEHTHSYGAFTQFQAFYDRVRAIQVGEVPDDHGWTFVVS